MSERKPIGKKMRFEIYKRDAFTCQYCGAAAPDVILEIDHINPVSKGGKNDIFNLVTSCRSCNSGKSDRKLDDNAVLLKQHEQLKEMNERRMQLAMMVEWRESMTDLLQQSIDSFNAQWSVITNGYEANERGRKSVKKWLRIYTLLELLDAADQSISSYGRMKNGIYTSESIEKAFKYIPRIARIERSGGLTDEEKELYYIRGILRNRLEYINERELMPMLRQAAQAGVSSWALSDLAKCVSNWTAFRDSVEYLINQTGDD